LKRFSSYKLLLCNLLSLRYFYIFLYSLFISQTGLLASVDSTILSQLSFANQIESNPTIKELLKSLKTAKNAEDSAQKYCQLTWFTTSYEPELINSYSQKAYNLLNRIKDPRIYSEILDARGKGYWMMGDPIQGTEYMKKSIEIAKKYG